MSNLTSLIEGAYDLHVHSAPDVLPRKMDDLEMARRIIDSGMAGYCMKSHYFCTSERAELVSSFFPGCNAIGSITLNSSVGGINPAAVEMAARSGAKIVWMPTCDSEYEQKHIFGSDNGGKLPYWANIVLDMKKNNVSSPTINLVKDGKLLKEVIEVLDIVARYDIAIATGHISHEETFALVKACKENHVKKVIITHADFPSTFYSISEQKELVSYGAYIEHCYTTYATKKIDFEHTLDQIRAIGSERVIISTDLGQTTGVYPDEGILDFSKRLFSAGMNERDIRMMNRDNPKKLINLQ